MDAFQIIQHFFTRMHCQECSESFSKDDVELLRREDTLYVVNVFCHKCQAANGVALVGVDMANLDALDEHDLDHAEFDLDLSESNDHEDANDIFIPVGLNSKNLGRAIRSSQGKHVIPEELLMQILAQAGAMMDNQKSRRTKRFEDPELTKSERERLSSYSAVTPDDVLDAHEFIQGLDSDWMKFIPAEMRQSQIAPRTESQAD